ncbi:MerR family transcriptional regulator [Pseudarthrobacter sp. W1I19]|uniref:MerR family transcriptional regulator n=1 Tax=Pseudarthrobacter sp. W1I19 TaxID=3042288 RepID=UPI0027D88F52|nr:MerR family transcriptional regulator [Pseudarthrobacter sp. W1I19]
MRIGELSERTGVSKRLLRYYEEKGLVVPARSYNGYREYQESHVDIVLQIKGLLEAGLPTRIIEQLMPCLIQPQTIYVPSVTPEMVDTLKLEQARLSERIDCLVRHRDAVGNYLDKVLALKPADSGSVHASHAVMT